MATPGVDRRGPRGGLSAAEQAAALGRAADYLSFRAGTLRDDQSGDAPRRVQLRVQTPGVAGVRAQRVEVQAAGIAPYVAGAVEAGVDVASHRQFTDWISARASVGQSVALFEVQAEQDDWLHSLTQEFLVPQVAAATAAIQGQGCDVSTCPVTLACDFGEVATHGRWRGFSAVAWKLRAQAAPVPFYPNGPAGYGAAWVPGSGPVGSSPQAWAVTQRDWGVWRSASRTFLAAFEQRLARASPSSNLEKFDVKMACPANVGAVLSYCGLAVAGGNAIQKGRIPDEANT